MMFDPLHFEVIHTQIREAMYTTGTIAVVKAKINDTVLKFPFVAISLAIQAVYT